MTKCRECRGSVEAFLYTSNRWESKEKHASVEV